MTITVICTRCGINEVPMPHSIEEDPVCDPCVGKMAAKINNTCPGWAIGKDCGNPKLSGGDLCPDCMMGRMDAKSPRIHQ